MDLAHLDDDDAAANRDIIEMSCLELEVDDVLDDAATIGVL